MSAPVAVCVTVNGVRYEKTVEPRVLLSDFIRQELGLTGTHVGCEHGVCGACTILFDGEAVRSCIMLAVQSDGHQLQTVEGLAEPGGQLNPLQAAFRQAHGLQCGFCTPGFLMTLTAFLRDNPAPDDAELRDALSAVMPQAEAARALVLAFQRKPRMAKAGLVSRAESTTTPSTGVVVSYPAATRSARGKNLGRLPSSAKMSRRPEPAVAAAR